MATPWISRCPFSRRDFFKFSGALAALFSLPPLSPRHRVATQADYAAMAEKAHVSMLQVFTIKNDILAEVAHTNQPAHVWTMSRVMDATYTLLLLSNGTKYTKDNALHLTCVERYWDVQPRGYAPGYYHEIVAGSRRRNIDRFTDDNLWIGLILAREYKRSPSQLVLQRARQVFDMTIKSWSYIHKGGVFWKQQLPGENDRIRVTISNAPAVELGVMLYEITGEGYFRQWSEKIFHWELSVMLDASDGLYCDSIRTDQKRNKWKLSYDQGRVAGAMVKMHEMDPKTYDIQQAVDLVVRALTYFDGQGYHTQPPYLNAVYFANLLYVASKVNISAFTQRIQRSLQGYVDELWRNYASARGDGTFVFPAALVKAARDFLARYGDEGDLQGRLDLNYSLLILHASVVHLTAMAALDEKSYGFVL